MTIASREFSQSAMAPRPEYPRPQFVRDEWMNLNGQWQFEIDRTDDGEARGMIRAEYSQSICVPFAPESDLSGIAADGFLEAVWYRREVVVPGAWRTKRVLLHFQACDHDTTVWVNGRLAGRHRGGFTPFTFDITDLLVDESTGTLVVRARDKNDAPQARGKQSRRLEPYEAYYTRTTGIWQTVWLEPVAATHLERPRITPDFSHGSFHFELPLINPGPSASFEITLSDAQGRVASTAVRADRTFSTQATVEIPPERLISWSPSNPHLYAISFVVKVGGEIVDRVESYAGLRSVSIDGHRILLNGKPFFQRLVLDQGWYPESLMTAPSDDALVVDIELAIKAGFNGARLHQKVFEERYLYHADRLGYVVWGEFGDWGVRTSGRQIPTASFITQWIEAVTRDYSHPSIVGWCPLNETFEPLTTDITILDDVTWGMYAATKALDQTRPVLDASGYSHRVVGADVYDSHNYEQDPAQFAVHMGGLVEGRPYVNTAEDGADWSISYAGQPYFCSEFAGIWWSDTESEGAASWGYGQAPLTKEQWYERAGGLLAVLRGDPLMFGYCFTQLTDVFQEKNGIFTFDRKPKFDLDRVRALQLIPAAIEAPENC
jgi:beta-galactosidase/beta-glucuronidase